MGASVLAPLLPFIVNDAGFSALATCMKLYQHCASAVSACYRMSSLWRFLA